MGNGDLSTMGDFAARFFVQIDELTFAINRAAQAMRDFGAAWEKLPEDVKRAL